MTIGASTPKTYRQDYNRQALIYHPRNKQKTFLSTHSTMSHGHMFELYCTSISLDLPFLLLSCTTNRSYVNGKHLPVMFFMKLGSVEAELTPHHPTSAKLPRLHADASSEISFAVGS